MLETINKALCSANLLREKELYLMHRQSLLESLSPREHQVLSGIIAGKQNKEISNDLHLSLKTVEAHRGTMMRKMKVKSVSELVKMVLSNDCKAYSL